jgi:hypothetical protein
MYCFLSNIELHTTQHLHYNMPKALGLGGEVAVPPNGL